MDILYISWLTYSSRGVSTVPGAETVTMGKQVHLHLLRRHRIPFCHESILPELHLVISLAFLSSISTLGVVTRCICQLVYVALATIHQRVLPSCQTLENSFSN